MVEFVGIDFGAQLSGKTVIAFLENERINLIQSTPKHNTDEWVKRFLKEYSPKMVFIDAPLSLPNAYYSKGDNFHFRVCDVLTKAMSPMFLGGLTARAMSLKKDFPQIQFYEVYPAFLQSKIIKSEWYKKDIDLFFEDIQANLPAVEHSLENWHQVDALLAWLSGYRFLNNGHQTIGDSQEGQIII